jgi:calcineurin-like phosphoesterase family protein
MTERVFFTADQHFGHGNIVRFCDRPFESIHHHDEALIAAWNAVVTPKDRVFVIGDVCWRGKPGEYIDRLNGHLFLVPGNHDSRRVIKHPRWRWVKNLVDIKVSGQRIVLCHYPLLTWRKRKWGAWMLHGHCHNGLSHEAPGGAGRLDIGVDTHPAYAPWSFDEIRQKMDTPIHNN